MLLCGPAGAQGIVPQTSTIQPNALATIYSPLSYGAICNGSPHSVSSTLGINTISALAAYTLTLNGVKTTPYSWITNGTWASMTVPLRLANAATTNATTFFLTDGDVDVPVGATVSGNNIPTSPVPTVTAVNNPATVTRVTNGTTSTVGTTSITVNSTTVTPVGSHPVPQAGLSADDYVVSSSATNITLKYGITAASIASGTTLTFQPLSSITISGSGLTGSKPSVTSASSVASASFTGSQSTTNLTASSVTGTIAIGQVITSTGTNETIVSQTSSPPGAPPTGGAGVYVVSVSQTLGSQTMTGVPNNYWVYAQWPMTNAMMAAAEMDWLGTQAAIEAATNAATGGTVQLPTGTCVMNNSSVANNTTGGLIQHPSIPDAVQQTAGVDFLGNGMSNTYLTWPAEMGAGRAARSFDVPWATWDNLLGRYQEQLYIGRSANFTMVGPAISPLGQVGSWTWGILSGTRNKIENVSIFNFYVGLTMETVDHTSWHNVWSEFNAIGLRMGPSGTFLYGNSYIDHIELYANGLAALSLDKDGLWVGTDIQTGYLASSPKAIRLEAGPNDTYGQPAVGTITIQSSNFRSILAEFIGEGFIVNDNHGPLGTASVAFNTELNMYNCDWDNLFMLQTSASLPAGSLFNYWMDLGNSEADNFSFVDGGLGPVSGGKNAFWLDNPNNFGYGGLSFKIPGLTGLISSFGWGQNLFGYGDVPFVQNQYEVRVEEPNSWKGHLEIFANAGSGSSAGALLQYTSGQYGADLSVQVAQGSAPFAGVAMGVTGTGGNLIPVATRFCANQFDASGSGPTPVTIATSGTATAGSWGKLATGGTITNATSPSDGVVIGTIMNVTGSAARVNVGPNGSCD